MTSVALFEEVRKRESLDGVVLVLLSLSQKSLLKPQSVESGRVFANCPEEARDASDPCHPLEKLGDTYHTQLKSGLTLDPESDLALPIGLDDLKPCPLISYRGGTLPRPLQSWVSIKY